MVHKDLAYQEEAEKLADVVRYIKEERIRLEGEMPAKAAYQQAANAIQEILEKNSATLWSALDQPYFGRIDYLERQDNGKQDDRGDRQRKIYIGITFISGKDVYSWTAPVAKLWYTQSYEDGYTAPKGYIPTRVDLKRYLRIRDSRLEDLNDVFRRELPTSDKTRQDVLTAALSGPGSDSGHLQVIVETIEPDQYEKIANVSDRVLIVQGAAGSGKSEIGLHRIAYLLSPFNEVSENERPTPRTTLFVGPSQAFLEYAADILPALGVQDNIEQVRFREWLNSRLSVRVAIRPRIWNRLLTEGDMRRFDEAAETFKGSLAMADAVERHVSELANIIKKQCLLLPTTIPGLDSASRLNRDQINETVRGVFGRGDQGNPLNRRREDFINQIMNLIRPVRQVRPWLNRSELERVRTANRNAVSSWCNEAWQRRDFREEYRGLLSDTEKMLRLAGANLTHDVAVRLAESVTGIRGQEFDDSDVGALAYFDHLLNGTVDRRYRHIVVDEAQDISPIEFKLLAASSTNNWFTVLGDTVQRLIPYRGIRGWREVERVFGRSEIEVQHARRSYRSTRQITIFNNRILRTFDENIPAPIPFEREGYRVEYHAHRNTAAMYQSIIDDIERIRALDELEESIVAILVRDRANLNRFQQYWKESGAGEITLVTEEHHSEARTFLGRIPDVRGLEYDAVIVMGVNDSFRDTVFNKKLLYLATTRARHYLGIHWSGRQSPILQLISNRGVTWHRS